MKGLIEKKEKRLARKRRIRARISGSASRPRLAYFKSNKYIYAQVINDEVGETLVGVSSLKLKGGNVAEQLGVLVAREAIAKGVESVVFDRGGFLYSQSVKTFADAARKGGLKF